MALRNIITSVITFFLVLVSIQQAYADEIYCSSSGNNQYYEWIEQISINGKAFNSGKNGGYISHTDEFVSLQPGENTVTLTPGFAFGSYSEYWRGWLDIDADGTFTNDEIVFEHNGNSAKDLTFDLPANVSAAITTLRVAMRFGSAPSPCGTYTYGETEDFIVAVEASDFDYEISAAFDFTLSRSGDIGDNIQWVIEKNGAIALKRNAASELQYKYYSNTFGSDIRAWIEQYRDGEYQRVSNIVEYTPGITNLFELNLGPDYLLERSGSLGDNVQWVVERNGTVVLKRNAANELDYTYYNNVSGDSYRVWMEQYLDGQYQRVSNIVSYQVDQAEFSLSVDQAFEIFRNGQLGDDVQWVIERDGNVVLQRLATDELSYTYYNNVPGSDYRVWLQKYINGSYQIVSNVVEYSVPSSYPFSLTLGAAYKVTRSGNLGDSVQWVIIKNGSVVLQRNAQNELSYTYYSNTPGSTIEIYLQQFIGGMYQPVSNTVQYSVP